MKSSATMPTQTILLAGLAIAIESVPEQVFEWLVEHSMRPSQAQTIPFVLSFVGMLVTCGFCVKRLHKLQHAMCNKA